MTRSHARFSSAHRFPTLPPLLSPAQHAGLLLSAWATISGMPSSLLANQSGGERIPPAAVAAAAASTEAVVKVIDGLSSWIADQSDDCAVAVVASAWGTDCTQITREGQDTGYWNAFITKEAENDCAYGYAQALAQEDPLGSWAARTTRPFVLAGTFPVHEGTPDDHHFARGWAKAQVDGHAEVESQQTPGGRGDASPNAGDVSLDITISALSLTTLSTSESSTASWNYRAYVDDMLVFSISAFLDHTGALSLSGDIPASMFTTAFDAEIGQWTTTLGVYSTSIFLMHLDPGRTSASLHIQTDDEMEAVDTVAPAPGSMALAGFALLMSLRRRRAAD